MEDLNDLGAVRGPGGGASIEIGAQTYTITGKFLTIASLENEWYADVGNPEQVAGALRLRQGIDIFTFWQRLPDTEPKYPYYQEQECVAAIPIRSYQHWWDNQIDSYGRNKVRKAAKRNIRIERTDLDDRLVTGIMGIYNESPVRRGKPFRHYGKDFDTVKREMSLDPDRSIFIEACLDNELVGFVKLLVTDRFGMICMILDKIAHRDKYVANGMIAKAVEICASQNLPFLTYLLWRRGSHGDFQRRNGFEKFQVPRYFIPVSEKGRIALKLGLHHGIKGLIPEKAMLKLLELRTKWYSRGLNQAHS